MNHQSLRDVFVVNNPALLTSGFSDQLATGQLGIFEADPNKDATAIAAPAFSVNKVIRFIQGTPEVPTNLLGAIANETKKSKAIKGRKILSFTGRKAERGHNQIVTIGYDGVDTTKTISAKCEETKTVFLKLSGGPIDQIFHTEGKGYVRQFSLFSGCCDDCGDNCADVSAETMANDLANQINNDPILGLGTRTGNKLVKASVISNSTPPTPDGECIEYFLVICDEGNDTALGLVQAQYPGETVVRSSRVGSNSTYKIVRDSLEAAPAVFTNDGFVVISDCGDCDSTAQTAVDAGFAYKIERQDAGTAGALTTLEGDYAIVAPETAARIAYEFGQSTYVVVVSAEIVAAVGTDEVHFIGETRNSCVVTTPTEVAWTVGETLNKFDKVFQITLKDNVCGESQLAALQAAYPSLVITEVSEQDCVRIYETTVESDCVQADCFPGTPTWVTPEPFNGIKWVAEEAAAQNGTAWGVKLESIYTDITADECAYDYWKYEAEPLVIEVSQHSQDYNDRPTTCVTEWPVTEIQANKIPVGVGSRVREEEAFFKGYERKYRDANPIVRQYQDSVLQADPQKFYDQYTIAFEFDYHQSWFSEKNTDSYRLEFYFPEGTGKAFEAAINAYVASVGIDLEPVVL